MKSIGFGREVTSHLEAALRREWLVTNGIGGFASGTIALANTRRAHGLLVAMLQPPLGRTLLVSKLEATARLEDDFFHLTTNEYVDGTINPHGYHNLESFVLEGTIPVFSWAIADNLLEQRVWMAHGHNTTYVTYTLVRASHPIALEIIPLCTYREVHGTTDVRGWTPNVQPVEGGLRVDAGAEAVPYWLRVDRGTFVPGVVRHWSIRHRLESYRNLDDREHLFAVGRLDAKLEEGETLSFVLTTEGDIKTDWKAAQEAEKARQFWLLNQSGLENEPGWIRRLVLAADQCVVDRVISDRGAPQEPDDKTIIAGYPCLDERCRETLMALPGITLATRRFDIAASILRTAFRSVTQGRMPNRCTDGAADRVSRADDTADTALWLIYTLHQYYARTNDGVLLEHLFAGLADILERYFKGTGSGPDVDESDGLLRTGEAFVGLTRMNAQDGDSVVTPRIGKPVEVNALWHNALVTMAHFAAELEKREEVAHWRNRAAQVAGSFTTRFWYKDGGYLYDVVDGPDGDDSTLRPNQILAIWVPFSPLEDREKARAVVKTVARHLQTSYGLRSLSVRDPAFVPRYGGNRSARANAYHQGTVWAWLLGPFVGAHLKVYGDTAKARSFLRPFEDHLAEHGLGTISEIFDGSPPHTPHGCIASALSVGQVLCSWLACSR